MSKKILSFAVACLLIQAFVSVKPARANSESDKEAKFAKRVKEGIFKLGVGEQTRVTVKLRDKKKLVGYITEAGENSFVVKDAKTGETTAVNYTNVTQVKGNNLSSGAQIAIVVAVIAFIVVIVAVSLPKT